MESSTLIIATFGPEWKHSEAVMLFKFNQRPNKDIITGPGSPPGQPLAAAIVSIQNFMVMETTGNQQIPDVITQMVCVCVCVCPLLAFLVFSI